MNSDPKGKTTVRLTESGAPWIYDPNCFQPELVGGGIFGNGNVPFTAPPTEPSIRAKAAETLRHLETAHEHMDMLEYSISGTGDANKKRSEPKSESLDAILARTSQLAALLVGRLATVNVKL